MPKIRYRKFNFRAETLDMIEKANAVIEDYTAQGFQLTVRQLYYQFVRRNWISNEVKSYNRLAETISNGRIAGLIDWLAIEDRTRNLRGIGHWESPEEIIRASAQGFALDKWATQPYRPEVWIEKDALAGVFAGVCNELDVPYFACRGYTSQSEMWLAAQRLSRYARDGQIPIILHFGDHDPSGIDMTRDIRERLELFSGGRVQRINRLALNMDQVDEYNPPPNPAKEVDPRFQTYLAEFGDESWELDALDPTTLAGIVREAVAQFRDESAWSQMEEEEAEHIEHLAKVSSNWDRVTEFVAGLE